MNLGKIASGMQGFEAWNQNAKIWNSKQKNINDAAVQMRVAYSAGKSGDKDAMETYRNLLSGKDSLHVGYTGGNARTIKNADGGRRIYLSSLGTDKNTRLASGVVLVHEAHRDGVVDENNEMETRESVGAHTIAALGLSGTYGKGFINGNENLKNDVAAYNEGSKAFAEYVDGTYDSSSDYWKLVENADGSLTLLDDGRGGVFYDGEDGEEHEMGHFTGGSRTGHLANVLSSYFGEVNESDLNREMLVGQGSAENYIDGHFLDIEGNQISIDLTGEWSDRMGAALDYDRMFVDSWRSDGNMDSMIDRLGLMNVATQYGADPSDREQYLMDMTAKATDFSNRFEEGLATEHLFSQTEIENAAGFGYEALCYATVPVNLYQLNDPSISLDMIGGALGAANNKGFIKKDGTVKKYDNYMKLLGHEFNSSQYLQKGSDFNNFQDYLKSDYSMADLGLYGFNDNEQHHKLLRNSYTTIDPYKGQLSWSEIEKYRYRGLSWMDF